MTYDTKYTYQLSENTQLLKKRRAVKSCAFGLFSV